MELLTELVKEFTNTKILVLGAYIVFILCVILTLTMFGLLEENTLIADCFKNIFNKLAYGKSFLKHFVVYWGRMLIYILILTTIVFVFLLNAKILSFVLRGIHWGFQSFSNFIIMMCVLTFIMSIIIAIKEKRKHLISEEKQN